MGETKPPMARADPAAASSSADKAINDDDLNDEVS